MLILLPPKQMSSLAHIGTGVPVATTRAPTAAASKSSPSTSDPRLRWPTPTTTGATSVADEEYDYPDYSEATEATTRK